MQHVAISCEGLSKAYHIGLKEEVPDTLVGAATSWLKSPVHNFHKLRKLNTFSANGDDHADIIWALRDLSFEVAEGEAVGIIGRNGAGKSTLLKVLSRITEPTSGKAIIKGRISSLLEVGTGFHPELTGRENVYMNGTILGMTKREIDRKFDEIVNFSGVEAFLDTPVKRYSSGMQVRLAFAVAAHLEPEILIIDEVLAVGDSAFQRKCLGKMGDVARQGRTVLFVSHNMGAITRLCTRGLWLDQGKLKAEGHIEDVVCRYLAEDASDCGEIAFKCPETAPGSDVVRLSAVRVLNCENNISNCLDARKPFHIELEYQVLKKVSGLRLGIRLLTCDGTAILSSTDGDEKGHDFVRVPGLHVSRCTIPGGFLNFGQYFVTVGADFPMQKVHFSLDPALTICIEPTGGVGAHIPDGRQGILRMQLSWDLSKTKRDAPLVDAGVVKIS